MRVTPPGPMGRPERGIMPLAALFAAVLLLGAGLGLALYVDRTYEAQHIGQLTAQAGILAETSTAALDFGDRQAAQDYIDALRANREISAAGLYDKAGALVASYPRQTPDDLPRIYQEGVQRPGTVLSVSAPVMLDNLRLGTVVLEAQAEPVTARIQRYGVIALLLAMAALVVAVLGAAQAALRRANVALAGRARELAAANEGLQQEIRQREHAEAALRQSQKMEAIGQLTGGVAHDFNNLLQVVLGSLERLRMRADRSGTPLDPDFDRMIEGAMQGGRRAATLTQRLLAFSRRQPLAPKLVDINKMVAGMSDLLARTLGETIHIETVLAGGLWRTMADENQLENALLNLAVNARDAMQGGGMLTIETGNAHLDEAYARSEDEVKSGQYVLLAVSDTGTGMPPDVLTKVFEPFFTTKGIGQGTGLGLSQVYGFIKQSGGHVKIYSEPEQGTSVKIYLPRQLASADDAVVKADPRPVPRGDIRECILVVEDEADVRSLTVEILTDLGYTVVQAGDGPSALALLAREPSVKLIFTDVGLPGGLNGRELADAALESRPDLKVVFTTGYARNSIVHAGRLDPGVELIGKPFSAVELAHRIRTVLDREGPSETVSFTK